MIFVERSFMLPRLEFTLKQKYSRKVVVFSLQKESARKSMGKIKDDMPKKHEPKRKHAKEHDAKSKKMRENKGCKDTRLSEKNGCKDTRQ